MAVNVAKVEFARPLYQLRNKVRVAINGFGTIGRALTWAIYGAGIKDLEIVAINDRFSTVQLARALRRDSVYGKFPGSVVAEGNALEIDGQELKVFAEKDPAKLPWEELEVDLVFDATGRFLDLDGAMKHVSAGAKKVVLSAPHKEEADPGKIQTIVLGANEGELDVRNVDVFSNGSCTTNCLAPATKVLSSFGLEWLRMTTDHAYTMDQRLLDCPHDDSRRGRAAGLSQIITTTGAAKAVGLVLPDLIGKADGIAVRVPTPTVSLVDVTAVLKTEVTKDELLDAFRAAAAGPMKDILAVEEEPLVSKDFEGDPRSSTIDAPATTVLFADKDNGDKGNIVNVLSWYDNVWGFSNRFRDLAMLIASEMQKDGLK
jgi:glyceraldehyde 3-phosphate dehydrogenase